MLKIIRYESEFKEGDVVCITGIGRDRSNTAYAVYSGGYLKNIHNGGVYVDLHAYIGKSWVVIRLYNINDTVESVVDVMNLFDEHGILSKKYKN